MEEINCENLAQQGSFAASAKHLAASFIKKLIILYVLLSYDNIVTAVFLIF